jgi:hypothetical protein
MEGKDIGSNGLWGESPDLQGFVEGLSREGSARMVFSIASPVPFPQLRRVLPTTAARALARPSKMERKKRGPYPQRGQFQLGMPR